MIQRKLLNCCLQKTERKKHVYLKFLSLRSGPFFNFPLPLPLQGLRSLDSENSPNLIVWVARLKGTSVPNCVMKYTMSLMHS